MDGGQVEASIEVDLPPEAAWEALVDWEGQHHWVLASTVRATAGDGRGLGAGIEARTGFGPLSLVDPMTVTAWDPPRRVVLRHTGRLVRGEAVYEVERLGGNRSRVVWSEVLVAPAAALRPLYRVGTPLFGIMIRLSLRRFARWAPRRSG